MNNRVVERARSSPAPGRAVFIQRSKISRDPNNTTWTRSTDTFGHKILSSQGWKPGEYLGVKNANHADHYTAANASHIRLLLRDDNLGLGAQVGKGNAETFGLSLFSGVLGRLNGKSDEAIEMQQSAERDAELRSYQAQKYGTINFVRGGLLVGDKIESPTFPGTNGAGKKRKSVDNAAAMNSDIKKRKTTGGAAVVDSSAARMEQFEKRSTQDEPRLDGAVVEQQKNRTSRETTAGELEVSVALTKDERRKARQAKRERKEARRKAKEEKRLGRAKSTTADAEAALEENVNAVKEENALPTSSLSFGGSRHAVRQRYIQQKRMAGLDPQALKEIFMVKVSS